MRSHHQVLQASAAFLATGVLLFAASAAHSEEPDAVSTSGPELMDQIVVVANKDERSIREIAANVTVLSRADLNSQLATSVSDVFRYVPGVDYEGAGTRLQSKPTGTCRPLRPWGAWENLKKLRLRHFTWPATKAPS